MQVDHAYPIQLTLSLEDVELILSYLEKIDNPGDDVLADEIRNQTYS